MKKLLEWKVLFGLSVLLTIVLVSMTLVDIKKERNRFHKVVTALISSTRGIDSTNQVVMLNIDSLTARLALLTSQVERLERQKDSLSREPGNKTIQKSTEIQNAKPLRRPIFTVVDRNGNSIGKDGVSAGHLEGIRVTAGNGYAIIRMDVILGRDAAKIKEIPGVTGNFDWATLNYMAVPGDRIVLTVRKVVRLSSNDRPQENVDVGTVILTVPIHAP